MRGVRSSGIQQDRRSLQNPQQGALSEERRRGSLESRGKRRRLVRAIEAQHRPWREHIQRRHKANKHSRQQCEQCTRVRAVKCRRPRSPCRGMLPNPRHAGRSRRGTVLMSSQKFEYRICISRRILYSGLGARNRRHRQCGDRQPDPRVPVSICSHMRGPPKKRLISHCAINAARRYQCPPEGPPPIRNLAVNSTIGAAMSVTMPMM